MAAYYTDRPRFETDMLEVFRQESAIGPGGLGALSDNVKPGGGFVDEEADLDRMIFGSCEYAKDGLLPLTELFGDGPWCARLRSIADSMIEHAPYETPYGRRSLAQCRGQRRVPASPFAAGASARATRRIRSRPSRSATSTSRKSSPRSNGLPPHQMGPR